MNSSNFNYIVSAQKSTAVTACASGFFRKANELDLLIARSNRLEHFFVGIDCIHPFREISLFGRIPLLIAFRLPGEILDSVLVITAKFNSYQLAVLAFNSEGNIRTRVSGQVSSKIGRPSEYGIMGAIHSSGLIVLHMYEGLLRTVQWQDGKQGLKYFDVALGSDKIIDLAFLESTDTPTLAYLYTSFEDGAFLDICKLNISKQETMDVETSRVSAEGDASIMLISVPFGGIVIVGKESIFYRQGAYEKSIASPTLFNNTRPMFNCYRNMNKSGDQFILGDCDGHLFLLSVVRNLTSQRVQRLEIRLLGTTSIPECIACLDNSLIFIGSRYGDSQLIKLALNSIGSSFLLLESFCNLGPIRDMVVMKNEQTHQIVTCSGAFKDGSLRVIRNGIGLEVLASIDMAAVTGIFALKIGVTDPDNYLAISFALVTHLLRLDGEEMEETQLNGFDSGQATLWAGNAPMFLILQINPDSIRLISSDGCLMKAKWESPTRISLCSVNHFAGQIIVGSGADLFYLVVDCNEIRLISKIVCRTEISCLDISPTVPNSPSNFFAVGFWSSNHIAVYSVGEEIYEVDVQAVAFGVLPRSLLIVNLGPTLFLLVGMGDGTAHYFQMDSLKGNLSEQKAITLGKQPISLRKFIYKGLTNVFACSDRPMVIYSHMGKLALAAVNAKTIRHVVQLTSDFYQDSLAMADDCHFFIGTIDDIQKLHVRSVPLCQSVSRIAHQPETNSLAVLSSQNENIVHQRNVDEVETYSFRLLNANTFEEAFVYKFPVGEIAFSLLSIVFDNVTLPYYCVGTTWLNSTLGDEKKGRILTFRVVNNSIGSSVLDLVAETLVQGAVSSLASLNGHLACDIDNSVKVFEWNAGLNELRLVCSHYGFNQPLHLRTNGSYVLTGDFMRSITLLHFDGSKLEKVASDTGVEWITACEIVMSDAVLGAETCSNIFFCRVEPSENVDGVKRLKEIGRFHVGEMINVFRSGTTNNSDSALENSSLDLFTNTVLYGTIDGGLGIVAQIPEDVYTFLKELQQRISAETHNCMGMEHMAYRRFCTALRNEVSEGFIDGDLIETLLELPEKSVNSIAEGLTIPERMTEKSQELYSNADALLRVVESMSRIH